MPKKHTSGTLSKLPKPSRFLLADENWEDYEYRLQCLVEDEKPANMLEYRQLELITRCDIDIDRQYRIVSHHLNPLGEAESKGAEIVADQYRRALMHPDAFDRIMEEEEERGARKPVELPDGDERLTPIIAKRYAKQRELMAIHQRELGAADRRRRQAIAMLFEMQDRRKRTAVPDAEIVDVGDA